jgi:SAM-dependent methyltransferase
MSEPRTSEELARRFHEAYERLAPSFGYETRPETRAFDPTSKNGRLMIAVCAEIATPGATVTGEDSLHVESGESSRPRELLASKECFTSFAPYYDLLYADKDYAAEAHCVGAILKTHGVADAGRILDLGCGTGAHMLELKKLGYVMTGIDASRAMVDIALGKGLKASQADVRTVHVKDSFFDAVLALFHVASYQATIADFDALVDTARKSLKVGGLFIFDVWDGPSVLTYPPSVRVKWASDAHTSLVRIARPHGRPMDSQFDIDYTLYIESLAGGTPLRTAIIQKLTERHTLRYWFGSEIRDVLHGHRFEILAERVPERNDYSLQIVARCR